MIRLLLLFDFMFSTIGCVQNEQLLEPETKQEVSTLEHIEEEELRKRLSKKGFDLENLDPKNLQQMSKFEAALREAITEMNVEKNVHKTN